MAEARAAGIATAPPATAEDLAARLAPWLSARLDGTPAVEIREVSEPAQGFSSRTILFTAHWRANGETVHRPLVARLQRDTAVPMLADIFHQYRVMRAIAANSSAKVPVIDFAEEDDAVLGTPFFLMDRVEGRVPPDFPSYHEKGWFAESLTAAERTRCWWNGIEEMAKVHQIGWQAFPFLAQNRTDAPDARFYLEHFIGNWFDWARNGQSYPLIEDALRELLADAPPPGQSGLIWNDARLGNTMFAPDLSVASLFDFEVATLGPPEIDLAHWVYLDEVFSENFGVARIDGLPRGQEAVRGFERIYGHSMPDFAYYMAIAALKILILSIRNYGNDKDMGAPDALPGFLVRRLGDYMAEHRATRSAGSR